MKDTIEGLKRKSILTKDHVASFRKYIDIKYAHYDRSQKIVVLANSIQGVVYQNLQGLSEELKKEISLVVFQNTLAKGQEKIVYYDILHALAHYDNTTQEILGEIKQWLQLHAEHLEDGHEIDDTYIPNLLRYIQNPYDKIETPTQFDPSLDTVATIEEDGLIGPLPIPSLRNRTIYSTLAQTFTYARTFLKEYTPLFLRHLKTLHRFGKIQGDHLFYLRLSIAFILIATLIFPVWQSRFRPLRADQGLDNEREELYSIHITSVPQLLDEIMELGHLPQIFRYKEVDAFSLRAYLHSKGSLLGYEPYFTTIFNISHQFSLNPLVLFAIAGHEQGFVPKNHPRAQEIANNPFNVFESWQKYNTDIADTSAIAARTVINLSKNRPENVDPFLWINRKYAEDPNWWVGVRAIFLTLEDVVLGQ